MWGSVHFRWNPTTWLVVVVVFFSLGGVCMKSSSRFVICIKPEWLLCFVGWIVFKWGLFVPSLSLSSCVFALPVLLRWDHRQHSANRCQCCPNQTARRELALHNGAEHAACHASNRRNMTLICVMLFNFISLWHACFTTSWSAANRDWQTNRFIKSLLRCSNTEASASAHWKDMFYLCCQTRTDQKPSCCPQPVTFCELSL